MKLQSKLTADCHWTVNQWLCESGKGGRDFSIFAS